MDDLVSRLQEKMVSQSLTLSVAESCTGGALSARLTAQPGASNYFVGSVVSYANSVKSGFLGVPEELLQRYGAVTQQVAIVMVQGVMAKTGSDWGIATTGVAGPDGGTVDKPVGTVWVAICRRGKEPQTHLLHLSGDRRQIIDATVEKALQLLWSAAA